MTMTLNSEDFPTLNTVYVDVNVTFCKKAAQNLYEGDSCK